MIQKLIPFKTNTDSLHIIIRKGAHMSEYALLACTYAYGFYNNQYRLDKVCLYSLSATFFYACTDELHQLFVGGRTGQFTDVLIDTTGGIIAIIIIYIILRRKKHGLQDQ